MKPLQWRLSQACQDVEFKFESMFEPLLVIWPSLPNAVLVGNRRFWLRNHGCRRPSVAKLVGQHSCTALVGQTGCFGSRKQCCHSCDTYSFWDSKGLLLCKFWAAMTKIFYHVEMKFHQCCKNMPKTDDINTMSFTTLLSARIAEW